MKTYKIDLTKTPQENITEVLKLTVPIQLTVNKMSGSSLLRIDGVTITAMRDKYNTTGDSNDFIRIQFHMQMPGHYYGRGSTKNWSVMVRDGKISLSWVSKVLRELGDLFKEGKENEDKANEKLRIENEKIKDMRQRSGLSKEFSLSYSIGSNEFSVYINMRKLTENQVMEMSSACAQIAGISMEKKIA